MPVVVPSVGDLAGLFLRLLPRGAAWPKMMSALQPQAVAALMPTYKRLIDRDNNLLVDAFPETAVELLPEWEATLGLPDPCAGPDQTVARRQAHVVARLTQTNAPSIPSLTAFAAAVGYTITITEFAPARAGLLHAGDPIYGPDWAFAWRVTAEGITSAYFTAGNSFAGEPLATWGNAVLECEIRRIAPAHTIVQFAYVGSLAAGVWDGEGWDTNAWVV